MCRTANISECSVKGCRGMMYFQRNLKLEEFVTLVPVHLGIKADSGTRTGHLRCRKRGDRDDDLNSTLVVLDRRIDRSIAFDINGKQYQEDDPSRICRATLNDPDGVKS